MSQFAKMERNKLTTEQGELAVMRESLPSMLKKTPKNLACKGKLRKMKYKVHSFRKDMSITKAMCEVALDEFCPISILR